MNGSEVIVSERFLKILSELARRKVRRRKRVIGVWNEVVQRALQTMAWPRMVTTRQEYVPFYAGLDRTIMETMMPIAERIQMGRRFLRKTFISVELWGIVQQDTRTTHPQTSKEHCRIQFRKYYSAIKNLCRQHAPEHLRHAELLALCELNGWRTALENRRADEFSAIFFTKESWERWTGQPSNLRHRDS